MTRFIGIVAMLSIGLAAFACDKGSGSGSGGATDNKGGGASAGTGVQECDDYITKYEACISKMDPMAKAAAEPAFKAQRDSFKQAAGTPEAKAQLKTTCKQLLDS